MYKNKQQFICIRVSVTSQKPGKYIKQILQYIQFSSETQLSFLFVSLGIIYMNVIFATSCNCLCFRLHCMKKFTFLSKGIRDSTYSPRNNSFSFQSQKRKSEMHHFIMAISKLLFAFYFLFDIYHLHLLICLML